MKISNLPKIKPIPGDKILLVNLNKSYDQSKATGVYRRDSVYESARKYWAISAKKADKINYILGIYQGVVRIVIRITSYTICTEAEDGTVFSKPRFAFEGNIVLDSPYLNTDVSEFPFGRGGAIAYIPKANTW